MEIAFVVVGKLVESVTPATIRVPDAVNRDAESFVLGVPAQVAGVAELGRAAIARNELGYKPGSTGAGLRPDAVPIKAIVLTGKSAEPVKPVT